MTPLQRPNKKLKMSVRQNPLVVLDTTEKCLKSIEEIL